MAVAMAGGSAQVVCPGATVHVCHMHFMHDFLRVAARTNPWMWRKLLKPAAALQHAMGQATRAALAQAEKTRPQLDQVRVAFLTVGVQSPFAGNTGFWEFDTVPL
jgi:hypothetical protein